MKHLKLFKTEAEYTAYKDGEDYVTPNVSFIEETKGVNYEPVVTIKLITFAISGTEFQAEEGMT